jgi:beta-glucanase (GH16 family)
VLTLTPISDNQTFAGLSLDDVGNLPQNNVADISMDISDDGDSMIIKIAFEPTASVYAEPKLLFYDEFDGDALNPAKWSVCPNWDRQGRSTWDDSLVSVSGGFLRLGVVRDEDLGGSKTDVFRDARNWIRAGAVRTKELNHIDYMFENSFGYYEARIKFPQIRGTWGAFWLMTPTMSLPGYDGVIGTEIDIVESIFNDRGIYNAAYHWDGYGEHHKAVGSSEDDLPGDIDIYDGEFHIFSLDWSPVEYIFYVNGVEFWRSDGGGNFNNSGINQNPNYIKLSVEGAPWAGLLPADFTEGEMLVDYVRVYNQPKIRR